MNTHFEPILPDLGFDNSVNPAWFMVPSGERKPINLINAEGLTVVSRAPAIARITVVPDKKGVPQEPYFYSSSVRINEGSKRVSLAVLGNAPGITHLEVRNGNQLVKLLEVSVRPKITLKVAFNYVSDRFTTTRQSDSRLADVVMILNQIYVDQTNIEFVNNKVSHIKFDKDFGTAVNWRKDNNNRPLPGHEWDLVISKRHQESHINVFFVWRAENLVTNDHVWGMALDRDCFIDDERISDFDAARTIAHEIGHILGISDLSKTKRVRNPTTGDRERILVNADKYTLGYGTFIPRHQSNIMWEIARQIAGRK